jgi:outer membrane usher protein
LIALAACVSTLARAAPAPEATHGTASASESGTASNEMWLAVSLNGQMWDGTALVLGEPQGRVWVRGADLASWHLSVPKAEARLRGGESYYPLDALAGLSWRIDEPTQALMIDAPANLFDRVRVAGVTDDYEPVPPPPLGGFFNYDAVAQNAEGGATANALLEASVFGRAGAAVTRFIERYAQGSPMQSVRLDTTWTLDRPQSAASLRVGDSITGASRWWGGAVRFGGIQWASNFATRPGLITLPLPSVAGESALPSTLELYVNDALRMRQNVPEGPFTVNDVPVVTGDGQIRLVVRDMLGREQVITQSYYASPRLLRPGLHEYSIEAGVARENYGLMSNDYGRPLIVGTDRFGITDHFTTEVHGELLTDQQTAGVAGGLLVPHLGVLSVALAGSHSARGAGTLIALGFERTARRFGFGANAQLASAAFAQIGLLPGESVPRSMGQVFANLALGPHAGTLSFLAARQDFRDKESVEIANLRYGVDVRGIGYISLSALRTLSGNRDTLLGLSFNRSLGATRNTSFNMTSQAAGTSADAQLQQSLPAGTGMGYRVRASAGELGGFYGDLAYQNDVGRYEIEAAQLQGATVGRAGISGGVAFLDRHAFPSREIDGSFAIAQVGDEANVRIYRDNQLVAHTDEDGYAILPGLRAYQDNLIRIEQADLPLDIEMDAMQIEAVPHYRSGVLVKFPVERAYGAVLKVVQENGTALPAGAMVTLPGRDQPAPVGMQGEVYVTRLGKQNHLRATWKNHACEFDAPFAPSDDPLPHLGPFTCKAGRP